MSDERREAVAKAFQANAIGPNLSYLLADAALAAIDATTGPVAAVSATEVEIASEIAWDHILGYEKHSWQKVRDGGDPEWMVSLEQQRTAMRAALESFLAARTPARAEPTEAEIAAACREMWQRLYGAHCGEMTWDNAIATARPNGWEQLATSLRDAVCASLVAARTPARAEPTPEGFSAKMAENPDPGAAPEPTPGEIAAALEAHMEATRAGMVSEERMRAALIAARNAGQGGE